MKKSKMNSWMFWITGVVVPMATAVAAIVQVVRNIAQAKENR